jgi:hypothetical protein
MLPFSTEFPIAPNRNSAAFIAEVIAWLRGNPSSNVLEQSSEKELEGENAILISETGEELRLREIRESGQDVAVGFRHDFPDNEGRIWRTEAVLKRQGAGESDLIRFRTQCRASRPGATLETPKKPFLIKALLSGGWGALDGQIKVSDAPIWLPDDEAGLNLATNLTNGSLTHWLPMLYVSVNDSGDWALTKDQIAKLAYDLGGVAHVAVEPNRRFSFKLRDRTAGCNVYSGAVGISLPETGIITRLFIGWHMPDRNALTVALKNTITTLRERIPAKGWDWSDLQELSLRKQRGALQIAPQSQDIEDLFENFSRQLEELQSDKRILEQKLSELQSEVFKTHDKPDSVAVILRVTPEIYSGEIFDRLRLAAKITLANADAVGLDRRSRSVLEKISSMLPSPDLKELKLDLARATKDPKRVAAELVGLLKRHGYNEKSDNRHIRLEAQAQFDGLDAITLPKTPSENRGLENLRKQIETTLGLTKL